MPRPQEQKFPDLFETLEDEEDTAEMIFTNVLEGHFRGEWYDRPDTEEIVDSRNELTLKMPGIKNRSEDDPVICEVESNRGKFGTWKIQILYAPVGFHEWYEFNEISGNRQDFLDFLNKKVSI